MIPRLKPYLGIEEFLASFQRMPDAVERFENEFAHIFGARHAIAFPYGRSALWAFFKALGIEEAEVIMPAYTCVVVAHAIVLSGNRPRFVDISTDDYNMGLTQFAEAINERTRVVIPTHLFGYPMDVEAVDEIVRAAEARYGHKIWIIQDCAHSFGVKWAGKLVCSQGDAALFGLNISKTITSIFGGMLTTNDQVLAENLRSWRDNHFEQPAPTKAISRWLYLSAVYPAFQDVFVGLVYWLGEKTPLLDRLTKAYHLDEKIHFPPDYMERMCLIEAQVGLTQLRKYAEIVERRREHARYYTEQLQGVPGLELPPLIDGATYSHYVVRVHDRDQTLKEMARDSVQLGQMIEYSVPHMESYREYSTQQEFPNSLMCSRQTVNLPVYASLNPKQRERIVQKFIWAAGT